MDCSPFSSSVHEIFQEDWRKLPCSPPGHLRDPGIKPVSLTSAYWEAGSLSLAPSFDTYVSLVQQKSHKDKGNRVNNEKVKVAQLCPTLCDPTEYTVHGILQGRIPEWVAFPFSRASFHPGIKPTSSKLQADSSPAEPQGKPKNIGMGSLSLLQGIFPTQELNRDLLQCRWILYQLS